ncbi:MAG TPA: D-alanyl-D-alanine carboxypeptidase family protein [Novosphingobium sp.]|jgi:D-alanyl-D-alanine carboxypeptidase (penicillin-binding protein 5/6)|nr:D-alanyl-D-alanine carboxypeptidase family protein [Novosphingobium sp.]HQN54508.1 D-alanyl-D-alanine carboxypeptidase family protein [Novosphingobium sp.]HQQ09082.1 D-alanyl-D-alanine carboxypeptidase family protein [Novosphingobium sp.]
MLVLALPASASAPAQPAPPAEARLAQVALVVDLSAGQTLYAQEAERQFLPASMTKAMSALVAFDLIKAGKLDQDAIVTVRPETAQRWAGKGTTLSLRPGEQVRIGDLLMGMTTVSANDASVALAESALGSAQAWVAAMNARALDLGMTGSRFGTPSGWPDKGATMVTARDLVRLAQALIVDHPELYRQYFGHQAMVWHGARLTSHDPFAGVLEGADGIKTGHTKEAGFNFLGAAQRGGRRLIVVIAGARTEADRAAAARSLAEWGYAAWDSRPFVSAGQIVGEARVQQGDARRVPLALPRAFAISVPRGVRSGVSTRIVYSGPLVAPLAKGATVAGLEVRIDGRPPHYLPLVTAEAVGKAGPFDRIVNSLLGLLE